VRPHVRAPRHYSFVAGFHRQHPSSASACPLQLHYLRTWFLIDFVGAIPFDYVILLFSDHYYTALEGTKVLRVLKLLRLFRLLRLHNIYRFFGR